MKFNDKGLKLIMEFEGFRSTAYKDQGGVLTIGYGHTDNVYPGASISLQDAKDLLSKDINYKVSIIRSYITQELNDNQFSALVSFAYNLGTGALKGSTLLKLVNEGNFELASEQFERWDRVDGKEVNGLFRRRIAERDLFLDTVLHE